MTRAYHKDGPLGQIRQMADWAEDASRGIHGNREILRKIAENLRTAADALESQNVPTGSHHPETGSQVRSTGLVAPVDRAHGRHECDYCRRVDNDDEPASEWWYWQREGFWLCDDCYQP